MEKHLEDCLRNQEPTKYIFPFFWQHGEEKEILLEELCAIYNSGIREFCVESRPHQDFCQEKWWSDMKFLLEEAEKRNMRVWLLDDKKFPTGYANGWIRTHQELKKVSLRMEYLDVSGPENDCALLANRLDICEAYVSITAWKRGNDGEGFTGEYIELLPFYSEEMIYWDIPEGIWRVFFVIRTRRSILEKDEYIDLLSEKSCRAMIQAVYEPHYEHFGEYFGKTFVGFFFDEPGFANEDGTYHSVLGKPHMLIPWNDEIPGLLKEHLKKDLKDVINQLPMLWQDLGEKTAEFRVLYMDIVTKMASCNFSKQLGKWCREHQVLSVGHLIEDMGAHMRLGYGMGHFFRGLDGQDMAGMDIVLGQLHPGILNGKCAAPVIEDTIDPLFFSYTLPKMTASHAHFCPRKKGRAMCEIFGAFGWVEGVPMMKKIADEMLVSGINYFVPHAFNPREDDPECPPYFWDRGKNPQYEMFGRLMAYMRRCSHLLSDGIHQASVAVLYYPDAEWSGKEYYPLEQIAAKLSLNQIDFDIIPTEEIFKAKMQEEGIKINQEVFKVLLLPYSEYHSEKLEKKLQELMRKGLVVFQIGKEQKCREWKGEIESVGIGQLIEKLYASGIEKRIKDKEKDIPLRVYHYVRNATNIYVFLNESAVTSWEGDVVIKGKGVFYDAWENRMLPAEIKEGNLQLHLFPQEMKLLITDENEEPLEEQCKIKWREKFLQLPAKDAEMKKQVLDLRYTTNIWQQGKFVLFQKDMLLENLSKPGLFPKFSGKIRYETEIFMEQGKKYILLDLGKVGEVAQVWLNEEYLGAKIEAPYRFGLKDKWKCGKNMLRIEVVNNQAYSKRDSFSKYFQLPPSGLLGPVTLFYTEK